MTTAQVLPKELRLSAPPTMPRARSYLFKQQSTQSSYDLGTTIQLNLPRLQRSYLTKDTFLKFALQYVGTPGTGHTGDLDAIAKFPLCFDTCGAAGLIDKIEVYDYLGSTLLESTAGHGQLYTLLQDLSVSPEELGMHYNISSGTFIGGHSIGTYSLSQVGVVTYGNASHSDNFGLRQQVTSGAPFIDMKSDTSVTRVREYALPLFSFLGYLSTKYAPLHNGYTIQITLNPKNIAFGQIDTSTSLTATELDDTVSNPNETITVKDVYLAAQVLELGPEAEALLQTSTGGAPYIVPSKAFRNYVGSTTAGSTSFRLDLNLNVASLTNVLWFMRPTASWSKIQARSLSDRIRNYLQTWYFQYGSSILPQTSGIQCRSKNAVPRYGTEGSTTSNGLYDHSEAYIELLKARHGYTRPNHNTCISLDSYVEDTLLGYSTNHIRQMLPPGRFAAGLDLELVSGRANDMVCGMNTNGMNTSIYANFDPIEVPVATRVDAYCEYDAFINILPGVATTVSF